MAALKFPGGTILLYTAEFFLPARLLTIRSAPLIDKQKIEMSFYVSWNCPPALFVAVDSLQRHAEEFSELLLRFAKFFPG